MAAKKSSNKRHSIDNVPILMTTSTPAITTPLLRPVSPGRRKFIATELKQVAANDEKVDHDMKHTMQHVHEAKEQIRLLQAELLAMQKKLKENQAQLKMVNTEIVDPKSTKHKVGSRKRKPAKRAGHRRGITRVSGGQKAKTTKARSRSRSRSRGRGETKGDIQQQQHQHPHPHPHHHVITGPILTPTPRGRSRSRSRGRGSTEETEYVTVNVPVEKSAAAEPKKDGRNWRFRSNIAGRAMEALDKSINTVNTAEPRGNLSRIKRAVKIPTKAVWNPVVNAAGATANALHNAASSVGNTLSTYF